MTGFIFLTSCTHFGGKRVRGNGVMQAQPDIGRLAGDKPGETFDGQIDALAFVGPAGIEHDEGIFRMSEIGKHLAFGRRTRR